MKFLNLNMRNILLFVFFLSNSINAQNLYYPDKVWEEKSPQFFGYDDEKIVIVTRWIDSYKIGEFVKKVINAKY